MIETTGFPVFFSPILSLLEPLGFPNTFGQRATHFQALLASFSWRKGRQIPKKTGNS